MNRLFIAVACCLCLASVSVAAPAKKDKKKPAAEKGPDIALLFNKLDTNNDKKVSPKEFESFNGLMADKAKKAAKAKKANKPANANKAAKKAGKVAKKAGKVKKAGKAKKAGKGNQSTGSASQKAEWFKKLDANSDGFLSLDEFTKVKEVVGAPAKAGKKKKPN